MKKFLDTKWPVLSIVICIILVIVFTACDTEQKSYEELVEENDILNYEVYDLQSEVEDLKGEIDWLSDSVEEYEYELSEYEESLVLIVEGSRDYHKCIGYCDIVSDSSFCQEDDNTYTVYYFWAADAKGFEACPECYK